MKYNRYILPCIFIFLLILVIRYIFYTIESNIILIQSLETQSSSNNNNNHNNNIISNINSYNKHYTKLSSNEFKKELNELILMIHESLFMIKYHSDPKLIRYDRISIQEIHILYLLYHSLRQYNITNEDIDMNHIYNGYQCSTLHQQQQVVISKYISMDICSEIEWYKVAQLVWPNVDVILDVGKLTLLYLYII